VFNYLIFIFIEKNQVRHICTESQKKKFMDLFALADSDSEDESLLQQKGLTKGKCKTIMLGLKKSL